MADNSTTSISATALVFTCRRHAVITLCSETKGLVAKRVVLCTVVMPKETELVTKSHCVATLACG